MQPHTLVTCGSDSCIPLTSRKIVARRKGCCLGVTMVWNRNIDVAAAAQPAVLKAVELAKVAKASPLGATAGAHAQLASAVAAKHKGLKQRATLSDHEREFMVFVKSFKNAIRQDVHRRPDAAASWLHAAGNGKS